MRPLRGKRYSRGKAACEAAELRDSLLPSCPETLEHLSRPYVFPKGVELFRQGFAPDYVYYLDGGLVKLNFCSEDGREIIINLAKPDSILGASQAILGALHAVSAVTVQRCWLRCISTLGFLEALTTDHQLSLLVNRVVSREASDMLVHSAELAVSDARSRFEQFLWNLMSSFEQVEQQRMVRLQLPITREEIAELIAVTPQYLSRLFKRLAEEGVLRKDKGSMIIIDTRMLSH